MTADRIPYNPTKREAIVNAERVQSAIASLRGARVQYRGGNDKVRALFATAAAALTDVAAALYDEIGGME